MVLSTVISGRLLKGLTAALLGGLAIGLALLWCAAAAALGRRMRADADSMEFLWSAARVRPGLRRRLLKKFGPPAHGQDDLTPG